MRTLTPSRMEHYQGMAIDAQSIRIMTLEAALSIIAAVLDTTDPIMAHAYRIAHAAISTPDGNTK